MGKNRVQRVKPVWRVFWDGVGANQIMTGTAGAAGASNDDVITAAEVEDLDDNCLVKRIVGEISWLITPTDGTSALGLFWVHMGLLVEDTQYDATTLAPSDAGDAQDAPWMWLRTYFGAGSAIAFEGGNAHRDTTDGGGLLSTHIDIKVARKLRNGDALRLKVFGRADTAAWTVLYHTNLRVLIEA